MGDGTEQNPFTREDVLRLIEENGGTAEGLDLSEKWFEKGIDLSDLDLSGIILRDAELMSAHLERAILFVADLQGANLMDAHLEDAVLIRADLERALLYDAHLEGASLHGTNYLNARLEHADWGNYIIGEEKRGMFGSAATTYRRLKVLYTEYGLYEMAGEFSFREMTAKRKNFWWGGNKSKALGEFLHPSKPKELSKAIFPRKPFHWAWSKLLSILCGYGERPFRTVASAALVVFGLAFIYFVANSVWEWGAFWSSLYFSAVSFTALGYGSWLWTTSDLIRGLGAAESFLGVFMMALFLITFVRKMTR